MTRMPRNSYQSFEPWRGSKYDKTRLLLLGESAYPWEDEQGRLKHPEVNHPEILVREVLSDPRKAFDEMPFMKTLSRGLAGKQNPSRECLHHVWNHVAFTDYVGGTTGEGARERPTSAQWEAAKRAFRPDILNKLRPRRIIVIGKGMWGEMPETDVHMTDDVQGYLLKDGSVAVCWSLPHTAAGLSWSRLADTIYFALGRELPRSGRCPVDGKSCRSD